MVPLGGLLGWFFSSAPRGCQMHPTSQPLERVGWEGGVCGETNLEPGSYPPPADPPPPPVPYDLVIREYRV